jgi:hypothetical protein
MSASWSSVYPLKRKLRWPTEAIPEGLSSTPTSNAREKTRDVLHEVSSRTCLSSPGLKCLHPVLEMV